MFRLLADENFNGDILMPHYAYERVAAGDPMPGVFTLHGKFPIGQAIEE